MRRVSEHAPDDRHAICDKQCEVAFQFVGPGRRHVSVHLHEPRYEEAIGTIDDAGAFRHRHVVDHVDRADHAVADDDCLLSDDPLTGHRDDVDVDKSSDLAGGCAAGKGQDEKKNATTHDGFRNWLRFTVPRV